MGARACLIELRAAFQPLAASTAVDVHSELHTPFDIFGGVLDFFSAAFQITASALNRIAACKCGKNCGGKYCDQAFHCRSFQAAMQESYPGLSGTGPAKCGRTALKHLVCPAVRYMRSGKRVTMTPSKSSRPPCLPCLSP